MRGDGSGEIVGEMCRLLLLLSLLLFHRLVTYASSTIRGRPAVVSMITPGGAFAFGAFAPLYLCSSPLEPLEAFVARRSPPSLTSIPLEPLEAVIRLRIAPQAACLTFTPVRIRIIERVPCRVPISQLHFDGLARGRGEDHQRKSGGARSAPQHSTRSAKRCDGAHAHTEHTQCALSQCRALEAPHAPVANGSNGGQTQDP